MRKFRCIATYLFMLSFVLLACSTKTSGTESVLLSSPTPSSSPGIERPEPRNMSSGVTPLVPEPVATHTLTSRVNLIRITEERSVVGVRWSPDGCRVEYATVGGEWWAFETTGSHYSIAPPFNRNFQLRLEQLQVRPVSPTVMWFRGSLSPSGTQLVYTRLPAGYHYTPAPGEFYLPPYEIGVTQTDGGSPRSLVVQQTSIVG